MLQNIAFDSNTYCSSNAKIVLNKQRCFNIGGFIMEGTMKCAIYHGAKNIVIIAEN